MCAVEAGLAEEGTRLQRHIHPDACGEVACRRARALVGAYLQPVGELRHGVD